MMKRFRKYLKKLYQLRFLVFTFISGSLSLIRSATDQTLS